jgi:EcsC protein family
LESIPLRGLVRAEVKAITWSAVMVQVPVQVPTIPVPAMVQVPVPTSVVPQVGSADLSPGDLATLRDAVFRLEHMSLAHRLSVALGNQLGRLARFVPGPISGSVDKAAEAAIRAALRVAMRSLGRRSRRQQRAAHKAVATFSGAAGGAFGLMSLPVELPFSTIVMLRSIAAIAQAEGEDLGAAETQFACLQVFAFGTGGEPQPFMESSYFAMRGVLAKSVSEAARYVVERGLAEESAPVIVRLVTQIATRFGVVVSQKLAAQAVPLIGAAGGAAVNYAFIDHFQSVARGHFAVRRLEGIYGPELVRAEYERLRREIPPGRA